MKSIKFISILALLNIVVSAFSQNNIVDEIAWIVGDEIILKSDVEEQKIRMQMEGEKIKGDPYCYIPEQMALTKLFLDQAKIDSIEADEKNVDQQVEMRLNYMVGQIGSKDKLAEYFMKDYEDIRTELKDMVRTQQLVQQVQNKVVGTIQSTPAEIRKFANSLPEDSLPSIPSQVEVQILTVEPFITKEEIEEVKDKLRDFQKRCDDGSTSFSTLAIFYSEDAESAKRGGELGFMGRGQLVKEYADVAFAMYEPGKISKIVESEFGFHLIQLIERKDEKVNTRHILLKPKASLENMNKAKARIDSIAQIINDKKFTFEQCVSLYSTDKNTRNCSGILTNMQTGTTKHEMQELPQEVGRAVYSLEEGQISKPFLMVDRSGKTVYCIAKLKSKTKAHKANMSNDFALLKQMYEAHKKQEKLNNWIAKKQKDTYVRIDENWKKCDFEHDGWIK
ncbi:MAG: peptidylprolyl isomerase [Paludibacteraceae bacterium]|nr:peptidylprolyl isomerase [Paludibacteraceae bacterium]